MMRRLLTKQVFSAYAGSCSARRANFYALRHGSTWALELNQSNTLAERTPTDEQLRSPVRPWTSIGIDERIAHALVCAGFQEPSRIQKIAAHPIRNANATLVAAETGAGKTFAYLAPVLSALRENEQQGSPRLIRRPRALILCPTRELVAQVRSAAVSVARGLVSVRTHTGGLLRSTQQKALGQAPVDVLVVTPDALARLRRQRAIFLSNVRHAIFDEADVLLRPGGGFDESANALLTSLRATADRENRIISHIYAAASVPRSLRSALTDWHGDDLIEAKTTSLHKGPNSERVRTEFVRVNGGEDSKFLETAKIVRGILNQDRKSRVMVFCDSHSRRVKLTDVLREQIGLPVVHISGGKDMDMEERTDAWEAFKDRRDEEQNSDEEPTRIAVCAQSFGRGIDHTGVTCVVMVDVPMTGTEFMHRAGRIRGKGTVFMLVSRRERSMGAALYLALVKGERLAGLTAQIARQELPKGIPKPLRGDDASAAARAKKKLSVLWIDPKANPSRTRRSRHRAR